MHSMLGHEVDGGIGCPSCAARWTDARVALNVVREKGVGQGGERCVAILLDGLVKGSAARIAQGIARRRRQGLASGAEGVGMGHLSARAVLLHTSGVDGLRT